MMVDLKQFIEPNDVALVGVSGGADSLCLLHLASELQKEVKFRLIAVHVNHGIRGEEALRDQRVVENFCKARSIELVVCNVDALKRAKDGMSLEQAARELRYQAFEKVKKEKGANKILVAHNLNDQAETVLMHIARGSSVSGAAAMSERSGGVLRPLLNTSRAEIENYCREKGIEYVIDSTNLCVDYSRNFIRHEVLPLIKKAYPAIESSLCSFAKMCRTDDEFIESLVPSECLEEKDGGVVIFLKAAKLDDALLFRLIRRALKKLNIFCDISQVHLRAIKSLFEKQSGARLALPHGLAALKSADGVFLASEQRAPSAEQAKFAIGEFQLCGQGVLVEEVGVPKKFKAGEQIIDLDKVPEGALLRTRRAGDFFTKLGSAGKKTFASYLTDKKVLNRQRDSLIVLASGSEVLVALGLDIGERVKIDSETRRAAKISFNKDK